jgi:hypothetical protein
MFIKTAIALVLVLATASGALAESRKGTNPAWNVYDNGRYLGSDPDPTVRNMLRHDQDSR